LNQNNLALSGWSFVNFNDLKIFYASFFIATYLVENILNFKTGQRNQAGAWERAKVLYCQSCTQEQGSRNDAKAQRKMHS